MKAKEYIYSHEIRQHLHALKESIDKEREFLRYRMQVCLTELSHPKRNAGSVNENTAAASSDVWTSKMEILSRELNELRRWSLILEDVNRRLNS